MSKYTGLECPVCKETFKDGDDIVVCPDCGAPYHRSCYELTGHCLYQDKHGTDQAWQAQEHTHQESGDRKCPRCGTVNSADSLFCSKCGQSLSYDSQSQGEPPTDSAESYTTPPPPPGPGPNVGPAGTPYPFDPMGGVNPKDHIEGIEAGDMAKFVQANTPYYMGRFLNLSAFKRSRFNFAAFIFGGGWFLYRKQYILGTILAIFELAVSIGYSVIGKLYAVPLMDELLPKDTNPLKYIIGFTQSWDALAAKASYLPYLLMVPLILGICMLAIHIFSGIFANKLYLKHCVKNIHTIKVGTNSTQEYETKLKAKGGVNLPLAFSLLICYFIISNIPYIFNL